VGAAGDHGVGPAHALDDRLAAIRLLAAQPPVQRTRSPQEPDGCIDLDRHRGERRERQPRVEGRQTDERQRDHEGRLHEPGQHARHRLRDRLDVAGHARDDVARARVLDRALVEAHRRGEHLLAQLGERPLQAGDQQASAHQQQQRRHGARRGHETGEDRDLA
jgi:hypothetical protein